MYSAVLMFLCAILSFNLSAQSNDKDSVIRYDVDFKFENGFYPTFEQVKQNAPVSPARLVSKHSPEEFNFYENVFSEDKIAFFDNLGTVVELEKSSIWGYADKGVLYINYDDDFNRIPIFGQISHFLAIVTVEYAVTPYDPMLSSQFQQPGTTNTATKEELRQFLLDYKSGKVYPFTHKNVQALLIDDNELYQEFTNLSSRKQKKEMFLFVRRYNEKHPVYFPKSNNK